MGTHHSHELEIGLKMLVYYLPFIPKNFSLKHDTCQFSIKTREIPHYIVSLVIDGLFRFALMTTPMVLLRTCWPKPRQLG